MKKSNMAIAGVVGVLSATAYGVARVMIKKKALEKIVLDGTHFNVEHMEEQENPQEEPIDVEAVDVDEEEEKETKEENVTNDEGITIDDSDIDE